MWDLWACVRTSGYSFFGLTGSNAVLSLASRRSGRAMSFQVVMIKSLLSAHSCDSSSKALVTLSSWFLTVGSTRPCGVAREARLDEEALGVLGATPAAGVGGARGVGAAEGGATIFRICEGQERMSIRAYGTCEDAAKGIPSPQSLRSRSSSTPLRMCPPCLRWSHR